jgi:NAD(P)-dependent dehydrogenase (short-subunit alcohol dehydrogenase family)
MMDTKSLVNAYDFTGKTIAITGGGGVLCGEMARALAGCHANLVILDRDVGLAEKVLATLGGTKGAHKAAFIDVLDKAAVQQAADKLIADYGKIDGLINGAGGNNPRATTNAEQSFFDIPAEAIQFVSNLNLQGTISAQSGVRPLHGPAEGRRDSERLVDERLAAADQNSRLFCGQGGG